MDSRLKKLKWNSVSALIYQLIVIITGFILPKCILHFYSSEVNGLVSSITQFLSFINICDLGIGAVVSSALYKPLAEKDEAKVSQIFVYAKRFFRVISAILLAYVVVLLFIYPNVVSDSFNAWFTISLILAMSISQFGQYFIGLAHQTLLNADQRSYIQLTTNGITLLLNTGVSILIMYLGGSIQLVKLIASIIYLMRPLVMYLYVRKHYRLDHKAKPDKDAIPQKKNGIIQHIAYMINENTDVLILTLFSTLTNVSIYSVYTMVVTSIKALITSATTGVQAFFGNLIANNETQRLRKAYDFYDWGMHTLSTFLFTVAGILIVPFVMVYTKGINDANYAVPTFAVLITIAYGLNSMRNNMYTLIRAAGHYKQTQPATLIEAGLNVVISIVLVFKFGLIGVAIGTMTSAAFFMLYEMYYLSKNILHKPLTEFLKQLGLDAIMIGLMIVATIWVEMKTVSYLSWFVTALIVGGICLAICLAVQLIFERKKLFGLFKKSFSKIKP